MAMIVEIKGNKLCIRIDLDDGVKVNYLKFGEALKKIPGLDAAEE